MKLEWDKIGERYFETGNDHAVLYPQNLDGTYEKGVAWNGITGFTESPDGAEPNELWADNIKYAVLRSAEQYGFTIEAYQSPEEFDACDGSASPGNLKGVYIGQQPRKPFGFSIRTQIGNDTATEGDDGYKLHIIYNATASPSERSYETINDSPDAITFSWECDTTPIAVGIDGYKPVSCITIDSRKFTDEAGKAKLKALEDMLYGTGNSAETGNPTLPTPLVVLTTLGYTPPQP